MINKITITLVALIVLIQTVNAEEKNNKLTQKLNQFWKCINHEIEEIEDFQIKKWNEGKNQVTKTLMVGKQNLTGFFSDFPGGNKKIMTNRFLKVIFISLIGLSLVQCSTYTVKTDMTKKGELTKTPKWYVKYDREDKSWMYETASSVSPDLELAIKKSTLLAKAKLADRINGKMNNQTSINKSETGNDENNNITGAAEDTIVNIVGNTVVKDYIVEKVEIFYTHHKSYRAYVKIKVSKENVDIILDEIKADKRITQLSKKPNKLKSKVKEVLKNID